MPEGSNFDVTAPSGSLNDIIDSTRFMVEATLNNNHIRIKWADTHGNAPSAESLKIQEIESYDERAATTEDIWRPFEKKRYAIDRAIIQAKTGVQLKEDFSVDYLEPNYPMSVEQEIAYWTWKFDRKLATPMDWFDYQNPDAPLQLREEFKKQTEEAQEQEAPANRLLSRLQGVK